MMNDKSMPSTEDAYIYKGTHYKQVQAGSAAAAPAA